jgi:lipopolysaccharide export system permease protein
MTKATERLAVTRFSDATFELAGLIDLGARTGRSIAEVSTPELLQPTPELEAETRASRAALLQEGHARFAQPFLAIAASLIGFAALLLGSFSRFGLWRQIVVAIALLIIVQLINTQATGVALRSDKAWPAVYLAPTIGTGIGLVLLWMSQRPRRRPRASYGRDEADRLGGAAV